MSYHFTRLVVQEYINEQNVSPFSLWYSTIDDVTADRVRVAILRVALGSFNNCKSLGKGLWEIKLVFGAGIRIYYGKRGDQIILLWGGTKNRQSDDILRANRYWEAYLQTEEHAAWH